MDMTGQVHAPETLKPSKNSPVYAYTKWKAAMGNSASLDVSEKRNQLLLPGIELRFFGCRSCSLLTVLTIT